jgi:hypothetical protein
MRTRLLLVTTLATLCACSNKPSDSTIRSLLSPPGTDKLYEIEDLKKTNGLQKDDHTYVASVHYNIVFKKGLEDFMSSNGAASSGVSAKDAVLVGYMMGRALASTAAGGGTLGDIVKAGGHASVDDEITLVKTDNGWQLASQ